MISNDKGKTANKLHNQKNKELQQKEDALQSVLNTLKTNPKFLKLLVYSLNSLESFVSPPNKDVRINAKIIIRLEGIGILKAVSTINLTNEDVVEQTSTIIWKIISVNDYIDYELTKMFTDAHGHEAVIEILLSKDKGKGSKPLIKVLNGLVQVPQLVQKMIESGLIETVKLVNDIYVDDQDIITLNFDTMKKISNLKAGREILIKKNLVPNLLKNIKISALQKDPIAVISGFNVVDNICRSEEGKEALKKGNAIENISQVLDLFETDDRVLKMGAKIYSKISKPEDMIKEIGKLDAIFFKQDYNDLRELQKSLALISNFMLVDDIGKLLCESDNLNLLINLFNALCNINLTDKSSDYIKTFVLMNKYFMIVFNRINSYLPTLFEGNELLYDNINNSIIKNWEIVKNMSCPQITSRKSVLHVSKEDEEDSSYTKVFKEYFSSYVDLIDKYVGNKGLSVVNLNVLKYILRMLVENNKNFCLDEKANFAASRVLKIANKIPNDDEIRMLLEKLFVYMKGVVNTSDNAKTLNNDLEVLFGVLSNSSTTYSDNFNLSNENVNPTMKEQILPVLINFMNNKPKFRNANMQNLRILDLIMAVPTFMDIYFRLLQKNYNLVNPIISVMARHIYETSTVLKVVSANESTDKSPDDSLPDEKTENEINMLGAKLLEKLVDVTEFKKMIKSFKDLIASYNPGTASMDTITNLEFHLLYFFSVLQIKSYFTYGLTEVLEALKQLLRKEISYIEGFKKDKNNEKNEKYLEIVNSSSKRLNLEIAILKLINNNCNKNYEESRNEAYISPIKEVISTILEIFDKSSDSSNLVDLLGHLQKNIQFLLDNESDLNTTDQVKKSSFSMDKKTEVKFEDSIIEKITNILMNLLRKSPDDENLAESIITTFIKLTGKKPETCNFLVKAGCPRLLLQIIENTSNRKLAKLALELIKIISLSSEENLKMVSNQNILEKLHEIHTKFANDGEITAICDDITNELMRLPGQENTINNIIKSNIEEFHKNMLNNAMETNQGKVSVLSNLEKINAFSSNKKQIELLNNESFLADLTDAISETVKDKQETDFNEKLLQNEVALLKKINDDVKSIEPKDQDKIGAIIDALLKLMKEKSNFRDVYLTAAKMLGDYISDEEIFEKHLKDKLDFEFVDSLFESAENYIDDAEVSKEINNILCNLCLRSEKLAAYIVQKGGLTNVMEELKSLVNLNDETSRNMKLNGLKFLQALVIDNENMDKFLKANGVDLINNLLKNELNLISSQVKDYSNNTNLYFMTNDTFNIEDEIKNNPPSSSTSPSEDGNTNPHTVYCFKIINENNEKNLGSFNDPKLFKNVLLLLDGNYPNKQLFSKGMELVIRAIETGAELDIEDKRLFNQVNLSNMAYYINNPELNDFSKKLIANENLLYLFDEDYLSLLAKDQGFPSQSEISTSAPPIYSDLLRVLTFSALYAEFDVNKASMVDNFNDNLFVFYKQLINFYAVSSNLMNKQYGFNEGVALALLKLTDYFTKNKKIDKKMFEENINSKLSTIALNYYKPTNFNYVNEFLKLFKSVHETVGNKDENGRITEDYTKFLQDIYLTSFSFFDNYSAFLDSCVPPKVEDNFGQIIGHIIQYYKIDQDADIKVSSIKSLTASCLQLISHPKLNADAKSYPRIRSLWEMLYYAIKKDVNNVILSNDLVIEEILDKLAEAIEKNPEDSLLREIYKLTTSKIENNPDLFEKIMDFIGKDLQENVDKENVLLDDVECIYNLSKFPIVSKILLKNNHKMLDTLKTAYKESVDKPNLRNMLSGILKNLLGNNFNKETIIEQHPDLISTLVDNINNNKPDLNIEIGHETAKNEIEAYIALLEDNYKILVQDKQIIEEGALNKTAELYLDDKEISEKLAALIEKISDINMAKLAEDNFNKDKDLCKSLCDYVKVQFDQHMSELQSINTDASNQLKPEAALVRGSTRIQTTMSNLSNISSAPQAKMSVISKTLFFNSDNLKIKSPLSCKDNCDIPQTIDQILNLLRKLYNENKIEKDTKVAEERNQMMFNLLQALKALSLSADNHKIILETGLMNFLEKLLVEQAKPIELYIETLDVIKNCTYSENSIPVFLDSSASEPVVQEVIALYDKPDLITHNKDMRQVFFHSNMIFSNLCKSKKGFDYLINKIGMDKLIDLGRKTSHVDILSAIIEMLINYLQNHSRNEINPLIKDIISILAKSFELKNKTQKLLSNSLILSGLIYAPDIIDQMMKLNIVNSMTNEFDKYSSEIEFLNAVLFCLGKITMNNVSYSREVIDLGLLEKLKEITTKGYITNEIIIENITSLYKNLVLNNLENIEKFCKRGIVINLFFCLENYWDKTPPEKNYPGSSSAPIVTQPHLAKEENQNLTNLSAALQIVLNCIACLDSLTISDKAIAYLAETKFSGLILETLNKKQNEIDIIKTALHCLGSYLYKEIGNNLKTIDFENLIKILIFMQKKHYSNSDILININYIAGYLIQIIKDKSAKEKLYMIISGTLKIQDWNVPLIIMTLKLMLEILTVNPQLIDDIFDDNMQCLFNLLKLYKENTEIQMYCYKILSLFGKNFIYSYTMVNAGLIDFIKETLDSEAANESKTKHLIREVILNLLIVLSNDVINAKKISDVLAGKLIKDLREEEFNNDMAIVIKLLYALSKNKNCIEPIIQYNGLDGLLKVLRENQTNVDLVFDGFSILSNVAADGNDEYKRMMISMRVIDLVNDIITKSAHLDKKIEFEGRSLIFAINNVSMKLDDIGDLNYVDIKVENPIKTEVRNFLVNGKIVKLINMNGDIKSMHLSITQDLLKISGKKPKSKLPPKPKYVIDTYNIKQIIKGHGTEAFKKSKGIFRGIPKAEKCFSIIGPATVDGVKAINVECEQEEEVNKWINYLEIIINYFKKTKAIKTAVVIKK